VGMLSQLAAITKVFEFGTRTVTVSAEDTHEQDLSVQHDPGYLTSSHVARRALNMDLRVPNVHVHCHTLQYLTLTFTFSDRVPINYHQDIAFSPFVSVPQNTL